MTQISTHVLDLAEGKPARGIPIRLERRAPDGVWQLLASTNTDDDGRCRDLLASHDFVTGDYRISFDTLSYFNSRKIQGLYPIVEITFRVQQTDKHFHIPLLLSPNGYTTYRGS
jgi:5-hydroxyisourate hydrolase